MSNLPDDPTIYEITTGERPGVIFLSGEFDLATRDQVRTSLDAVLDDRDPSGPNEFLVSVAGVRFIDAGTVRLLAQARQAALDTGRQLWVTGARGLIRRVIEVCDAGQQLLAPANVDAAAAANLGTRGAAGSAGPGSAVARNTCQYTCQHTWQRTWPHPWQRPNQDRTDP